MAKTTHEVRDPVHGFVLFDNFERRLIDSRPFQRLRHIHQLAFCQHVYPGATHRRFEHSLGVMETATRIFDSLFHGTSDVRPEVKERIADELQEMQRLHWRSVVRVAALLHDLGHLPFSHPGEDLLPHGWDHERLTAEIIRNSEVASILSGMRPAVDVEDVIDLCWDAKKRRDKTLDPWRTLLNEIITHDAFGADRIDYLLRDSLHCGVAYGRFDPFRLIDSLEVIIDPDTDEIAIGLSLGGIHAAEALLLARYFMYRQVYLHDVRRVYDIHLKDFLKAWLEGGCFPSDWERIISLTDNEVMAAMLAASSATDRKELTKLAQRITHRKHFRTVYELVAPDKKTCPGLVGQLYDFAIDKFGKNKILLDAYGPKSEQNDFWVVTDQETIERSSAVSSVIENVPAIDIAFIFASPDCCENVRKAIRTEYCKLLEESGKQD